MRNVRILVAGEKRTAFTALERILKRASDTYEVIAQVCEMPVILQMLQNEQVNIVLLDASGIDGISMCQKITSECPWACVVLIGGRRKYSYLKQAMDAGARGYISDDECTGEGLRREIDRIMESRYKNRDKNAGIQDTNLPMANRIAMRAIEFIQDNYQKNISFSDVAEYVGMSESHLRRCLKKNTQMSFVEFLTEARINAAKQMMLREDWPVSRISQEAGFSSARYFCKVFKEKTGKTPRDYINELGGMKLKKEDFK